MTNRIALCGVLASLSLAICGGVAAANPWVLLVQPAPYSQTPPPYSSWIEHRVYDTREACLMSRMSLHYEYWPTDRDLSMRALSGICRDQATGELAGLPSSDDDDWDDEDW
jgi:hypothetical protein